MTREEKMGETGYQALTIHIRKNFKKKENFHHNKKKEKKQEKTKGDPTNVRFYTCDEKGHFAIDCPIRKRRHHAHIAKDDEPKKKTFRREKDDLDEEYVIISTLTSTISHERNNWLVDSGASKHMMGYKESFINMSEHESPNKVNLGIITNTP